MSGDSLVSCGRRLGDGSGGEDVQVQGGRDVSWGDSGRMETDGSAGSRWSTKRWRGSGRDVH
jgi:hypothetical protein